jgi:hypothetical protein
MIQIPVRKDVIGEPGCESESGREYLLLELQGSLIPRVAESSLTPTKAAALIAPPKGSSQLGIKRRREQEKGVFDGKTIGKLTRVDKVSHEHPPSLTHLLTYSPPFSPGWWRSDMDMVGWMCFFSIDFIHSSSWPFHAVGTNGVSS